MAVRPQTTQAKFGTDGKTTLIPARSEADFAESKMRTGLLTPLAVDAGAQAIERNSNTVNLSMK